MSDAAVLDRVVWSALSGRHAGFALGDGGVRRYHPDLGVFAAVADRSEATLAGLAALVRAHGDVAFLEDSPPIEGPGLRVVSRDLGVQMVCDAVGEGPATGFAIAPLGDDDAAEMLALATLTVPGPFFARTHALGDFFGVRVDGRLVAMAGERLKPEGFTEVSGVCTHPDWRGRGLAGALMRLVASRVLARGEVPFLHAYARNTGAIALYGTLGFRVRKEVWMTRVGVR